MTKGSDDTYTQQNTGCNGYLRNEWMTVHVWQLSQEKTIWQYNLKPSPDKTNVSQNGTHRGTHKDASEGVCENVPKGLPDTGAPTYS